MDRSVDDGARARHGRDDFHDGGKTWSPVERSKIKHNTSRFFLRRLRSGALLMVKHGPLDQRTKREQLTAYISDDEAKSWQGGLMIDDRDYVTYPDGVQAEDGTIYLVYDYRRTAYRQISARLLEMTTQHPRPSA